MSQKKRGLGKGLAVLLETANEENELGQESILVNLIDANPYQPRKSFDEAALMTLVKSIQQHGVIQPIAVRKKADRYELIAGERRLRASKLAMKELIPAVVLDVTDRDSATFALIENLQREDLNAIEKANSISALISEFGLTHEQCADYLGQSRSSVSNLLRLLTLSDLVKQAVVDSVIEMGHARALVNLTESLQKDMLHEVVSRSLSVRNTEKMVKNLGESGKEKGIDKKKSKSYQYLSKTIKNHLEAEVDISTNSDKSGKILIKFTDTDSLKNIINVMGIDWIEPS